MTFATSELCDAHEHWFASGQLAVLPPVFRHFGRRRKFCGAAVTLRVFEDNVLVRSTLMTPGENRVLVIGGGGSLRCALAGGNLALLAEKNSWAGLLIDGCVRDASEIDACDIGVRALALNPKRSGRTGAGESNVGITVAGIAVSPGNWIYADEDGILVAAQRLD